MSVAVVFPGQGTHAPRMGVPWSNHPAWNVVDRAEKALGEPLAHLLVDASAEDLSKTRDAQLAVLTMSLVVWDAVQGEIPAPVAYSGHSLGQVTALIAAGALPFDDGVRFTARRAELTQSAADQSPGRMAALLGATEEQATLACDGATSWIANLNGEGQVVIAGTPPGVEAALARAREAGVRRARTLDVGGAFHTPLMDSARDGLRDALRDVDLAAPSAPVISNEDGRAYLGAAGWRERLVDHPTRPVRWAECMRTLEELGADTFVEVGHGTMIAGVARRTVPAVRVIGVATPEDLTSLEETPR